MAWDRKGLLQWRFAEVEEEFNLIIGVLEMSSGKTETGGQAQAESFWQA
jgi:hypothetical protein